MMNLYYWNKKLPGGDYLSALVLANNEKEAWELIYKEDKTAWWVLHDEPAEIFDIKQQSFAKAAHDHVPECGYYPTGIRPRIIDESQAFIFWSGC